MAGRTQYDLSQTAYIKLVLHALKHPAAPVNGLLLGPSPGSKQQTIAAEGGSRCEITAAGFSVAIEDAIPLFHSRMGLAPMLEIALGQVEEYCQERGLAVVGCYHANEHFEDRELGPVARRVADHIGKHTPWACALLVDNAVLAEAVRSKVSQPAVQLYTWDSLRSWRTPSGADAAQVRVWEATAAGLLVDYVAEERYREVADFDDHLDDITKDWLNPGLFR